LLNLFQTHFYEYISNSSSYKNYTLPTPTYLNHYYYYSLLYSILSRTTTNLMRLNQCISSSNSKHYKNEDDPAAGTNQPTTYYSVILHFHNTICSWLFPISAFAAIDSLTHYYSQHKTFSDKKQSRIRPYIMAVLIVDILVAVMTLWWLFKICKKKISNLHSIINFTISIYAEAQQHVKNYILLLNLSVYSTSNNPSIR
jgi:hypothetical protein